MTMHIRNALKGAGFSVALAVLIFFLKIICPVDTGCLADPFLVVLFSPLYLFNALGIESLILSAHEPFLILGFWALLGFIVGYLVSPFVSVFLVGRAVAGVGRLF